MIGRWLCWLGLHAWQVDRTWLTVGPSLLRCRRPGCRAQDAEEI